MVQDAVSSRGVVARRPCGEADLEFGHPCRADAACTERGQDHLGDLTGS